MRGGRRPEVHHSDEGAQYAATAYTDLLAGRGVVIRMAAVGKPEEEAGHSSLGYLTPAEFEPQWLRG